MRAAGDNVDVLEERAQPQAHHDENRQVEKRRQQFQEKAVSRLRDGSEPDDRVDRLGILQVGGVAVGIDERRQAMRGCPVHVHIVAREELHARAEVLGNCRYDLVPLFGPSVCELPLDQVKR